MGYAGEWLPFYLGYRILHGERGRVGMLFPSPID